MLTQYVDTANIVNVKLSPEDIIMTAVTRRTRTSPKFANC